tara:strand:+ start:210 stop:377 length:168 start_codon:yes stop_codon:yes gene_type:complete
MIEAIKFAMRYKHVLPELVEFAELCANSTENGLSKKERSALMKQYWVIVKAIQAS